MVVVTGFIEAPERSTLINPTPGLAPVGLLGSRKRPPVREPAQIMGLPELSLSRLWIIVTARRRPVLLCAVFLLRRPGRPHVAHGLQRIPRCRIRGTIRAWS